MIELENVSMTYPGGNQALKNVNINIEKGEHTGLDAQGAAVIVMKVKTGEIQKIPCTRSIKVPKANVIEYILRCI